jgi:hypothetical protein
MLVARIGDTRAASGWASIENCGYHLTSHSFRMDTFLAGTLILPSNGSLCRCCVQRRCAWRLLERDLQTFWPRWCASGVRTGTTGLRDPPRSLGRRPARGCSGAPPPGYQPDGQAPQLGRPFRRPACAWEGRHFEEARHRAETMSVFLKSSPLNRRGSPVTLASA